jgi:hypothetical protein
VWGLTPPRSGTARVFSGLVAGCVAKKDDRSKLIRDEMRAKGFQISHEGVARILKGPERRDAVAAERFSRTTECFSASGAVKQP